MFLIQLSFIVCGLEIHISVDRVTFFSSNVKGVLVNLLRGRGGGGEGMRTQKPKFRFFIEKTCKVISVGSIPRVSHQLLF